MIESVNTLKDLNILREKGLRVLAENLSPIEFVNFIRLFSNGEGDYTEEHKNDDIVEEDFLKYVIEKEGIDINFIQNKRTII
ncbi:MAG: hypothetical protein FWC47_10625 [Oscillospiraceae bacterium]|nr:hypothetical protein [Oscillospiraceae bacterium]